MHGLKHAWVLVPKGAYRCPATGIKVVLPTSIKKPTTLPAHRLGISFPAIAVKNMGYH
jgi:hypothetical protein